MVFHYWAYFFWGVLSLALMNLPSDLGLCDWLRSYQSCFCTLPDFMINDVSSGHCHNLAHVICQGQFTCLFLKYLNNFLTVAMFL